MSFYKYHVFFCTNRREPGESCCESASASKLRAYAKQKVKDLGSSIEGNVRINTAGCLNRCAEGPVIVIYPEDTWYTYVDEQDIDEIIEKHLMNGEIVDRLRLK
ncbi:MAG: (2Fe-2S) ferredoxin domain-containing protein [Gammaproteobacteria bacterium]|nr:(2Fe-2S) ferredoxin domain-containing protein [Gammaproteobacteria bacterium]